PSGSVVPARQFDEPLVPRGPVNPGTGGVVALDEGVAVQDVVRTLLAFNMRESCGKCTPCREGTARLLRMLDGPIGRERVSSLAASRTGLVHVEGQRGLAAAWHLPAREGMVVSTAHPDAVRVRRGVLDLTLSMLTPAKGEFGALGDAAARHGLGEPRFAPLHRFDVDASKSFFVLDREACILCGRCTVACDEVQQIGAIALLGRGHTTRVGVFG